MEKNAPSTNPSLKPKSFTHYLPTGARIVLGLIFFVFGLNGFCHFMPQPKSLPVAAQDFFGALMKTGYMIPLLFATQTLAGALLLINRFVPLALALIAPVIVNIVAFHLFLEPAGIPMATVVLLLELYLAWSYRNVYRPMLSCRATPAENKN